VLFVDGQVTFDATCVSGPGGGPITVTLPDQAYQIAANAGGWHPPAGSDMQGSTTVPDLCNGGAIRLGKGTFSARVLATNTPVKVNYRWHYLSGGWSGTYSVIPDPVS